MNETRIDPETWESMKSMTDPIFLVELIDVFLSDSPELIRQMQDGLLTGNTEGVRRAAHTLKSNAASFGATSLSSAARELEMLAKSGTLVDAQPKLNTLESEYQLIIPILEDLKRECKTT